MSDKTFYITTPIYYVNGLPHIGHAYTTIAADTITRWHRLLGHRARFLTGTDEHGQKVLDKARERGMSPKAHADDMVVHWKDAWKRLGVRYDRFIRTTDEDHIACVQGVLQRLFDEGEIYKDTYTGWYSTSVERFWTEKDLVDGKCPESGQPVQEITEANYFFRMGKYQQALIDHIEAHPDFIRPVARKNEVLGFLRKPLEDLCISRPKTRMAWGIEIPFDDEYVTYVWFDALLNYITGVGYPDESQPDWSYWPVDYHLIGKDILTTHAVYWSTMLMAMGVPLPKTLYAHGWWTSQDGAKMSKSLGNVIDVNLLADEFGVCATRYFFLRDIAFGHDGGFTYEGFLTRYNADLANDLGNLAHRSLSMTTKWLGDDAPASGEATEDEQALYALAATTLTTFQSEIEALQFNKALEALWTLIKAGNKYIDTQQPWALNRDGETERLATVMRTVLEICSLAGTLMLCVTPHKASELLGKLGHDSDAAGASLVGLLEQAAGGSVRFDALEGKTLTLGDPLFPRFRELPEKVAALLDSGEAEGAPAAAPSKKQKKQAQQQKKKAPKEAPKLPEGKIAYDDFAKVQLRVGEVVEAEKHPNADKLLVLKVDVGEPEPRTIVAGIASKYAPDEMVGKKVVVVVNLAPVKLRGVQSNGMLLAAGGKEVLALLTADAEAGESIH